MQAEVESELDESETALLSQEGSGIAKPIPRGVVPITQRFGFGTTPARSARFPLLTQEGEYSSPCLVPQSG